MMLVGQQNKLINETRMIRSFKPNRHDALYNSKIGIFTQPGCETDLNLEINIQKMQRNTYFETFS